MLVFDVLQINSIIEFGYGVKSFIEEFVISVYFQVLFLISIIRQFGVVWMKVCLNDCWINYMLYYFFMDYFYCLCEFCDIFLVRSECRCD